MSALVTHTGGPGARRCWRDPEVRRGHLSRAIGETGATTSPGAVDRSWALTGELGGGQGAVCPRPPAPTWLRHKPGQHSLPSRCVSGLRAPAHARGGLIRGLCSLCLASSPWDRPGHVLRVRRTGGFAASLLCSLSQILMADVRARKCTLPGGGVELQSPWPELPQDSLLISGSVGCPVSWPPGVGSAAFPFRACSLLCPFLSGLRALGLQSPPTARAHPPLSSPCVSGPQGHCVGAIQAESTPPPSKLSLTPGWALQKPRPGRDTPC